MGRVFRKYNDQLEQPIFWQYFDQVFPKQIAVSQPCCLKTVYIIMQSYPFETVLGWVFVCSFLEEVSQWEDLKLNSMDVWMSTRKVL